MASAGEEADAPKDIKFDAIVEDVCFHPGKDVIAAGDIDGQVTLHSYSTTETNHLLMTLNHHKKSCRALRFTPGGDTLLTASRDKSLRVVDVNQGKVTAAIKKAHECGIYSLLAVDENMVVTGDDDGYLKLWDLRHQKAVMVLRENEEFISDMALEKRVLLATSGDGTLTAFDIRKHKMKMQSELFDSEMLSLAVIKGTEKVVCGTGEGIINIFNWGQWGNISDRFPGHPMSIDCMVAVSKDVICTGSFDGTIRAVHITPNRFLGIVGQHEEYPVENLSMSHCETLIASCSHDQRIKFWNTANVPTESVDSQKKPKRATKMRVLNKSAAKNDFFADLADGDGGDNKASQSDDDNKSDSDSDDDSDGEASNDLTVENSGEGNDDQVDSSEDSEIDSEEDLEEEEEEGNADKAMVSSGEDSDDSCDDSDLDDSDHEPPDDR